MPERDLVQFRFTGGIASVGELNFYEAGRYRYAAARLLYTLEEFRQSGDTKKRLKKLVNVDIRTKGAREGSFIDDVMIYAGPVLADPHVRVGLDKVVGWAFDRILPKANQDGRVKDLTEKLIELNGQQIALGLERERTIQASIAANAEMFHELSRRLREAPSDPEALQDAATTFRRLEGLAIRASDDIGSMGYAADEIETELNRQSLLQDSEEEFARISPQAEEEIIRRVREIIPDLAVPLRRSATQFQIRGSGGQRPIAALNETRLEQLRTSRSGQEDIFVGNLQRYDKTQGYGRFQIRGDRSPVTFTVRPEARAELRDRIIDAMKEPQVEIIFTPIFDGTGKITKLILRGFSGEDLD